MADKTFANSPLITPDRLRNDRAAVFSIVPSWAAQGQALAPDLDLDQDTFVARIGGVEPMQLILYALSAAPVFELTRHGNGVTSNRNKAANAHGARLYPKLTIGGSQKDSMPLSRIVVAAGPHQAVHVGSDPGDLRPAELIVRGGGKPTKEAREVAVQHAAALARKAGADVDAYLTNLWALFGLHDELLLGTADY